MHFDHFWRFFLDFDMFAVGFWKWMGGCGVVEPLFYRDFHTAYCHCRCCCRTAAATPRTDFERSGRLQTLDLEVAEVQMLAAEPHALVVAVRWSAAAAAEWTAVAKLEVRLQVTELQLELEIEVQRLAAEPHSPVGAVRWSVVAVAKLEVQLQVMELQLELENSDWSKCIYRCPPCLEIPPHFFVPVGKSSFGQLLFTFLPKDHYPVTLLLNEVGLDDFLTCFCCCIRWLTFPSPLRRVCGWRVSVLSNSWQRSLPLPRRGGGAVNVDAAKSTLEKFIIFVSSFQANDAWQVGRANEGCRVGGGRGWNVWDGWRVSGIENDDCHEMGGRSILFEKFKIYGFSLPPKPMLMKRRRRLIIIRISRCWFESHKESFPKLFHCFIFVEFSGHFDRQRDEIWF